MDVVAHKMPYNINIFNIGKDIIWMWMDSPFAYREDGKIYYTDTHNRVKKVGKYIYLINQMKGEVVHVPEPYFLLNFKKYLKNKKVHYKLNL
jgi:hypothetical protein